MHSCFYSSSEITQELLLTLSNETNSHICDTVELGVHCAANFLVECFPLLKFKCIHFSTIAHNDDDDEDDDDDDDDDDDNYNDDDNEYFENVYNTLVYRGIGIGILSEMSALAIYLWLDSLVEIVKAMNGEVLRRESLRQMRKQENGVYM
uniref:Uncharacterized protein n=1 Tax=Glossina palpalis gambiensis TaxID=67801 RepID=A0A1B0BIP6_9MUSC